jgi:hypothetical protein
MPPIIIGIGLEAIIWLIILIFWGIAQAMSKPKRRPPPVAPTGSSMPRRPSESLDTELREMLEQLTGRTEAPHRPDLDEDHLSDEDEEMIPAPPPAPPPRPQRPPRPPPSVSAPPRIEPQTRPVVFAEHRMPSVAPLSTRLIEPQVDSEYAVDAASKIATEDYAIADASLRAGLNAPGLSMRMKVMSMRGIAMLPSVNPTGRQGVPVLSLRELRDRRELRKATLAKVILDPPRGLVPFGAPTPI